MNEEMKEAFITFLKERLVLQVETEFESDYDGVGGYASVSVVLGIKDEKGDMICTIANDSSSFRV